MRIKKTLFLFLILIDSTTLGNSIRKFDFILGTPISLNYILSKSGNPNRVLGGEEGKENRSERYI
jgi:hypothetical protein